MCDLGIRPSKIIRSEIQAVGEEALKPNDLKSISKSVYKIRRKTYPPLPKSREEVHQALSSMDIQTNKGENFLQVNNTAEGLIVLTTYINLECLCSVKELFMDGTFKCCPRFFQQLYTIHGFSNGNCVPLVYVLLSGKSEDVYRTCLTSIIGLCDDKNLKFKPEIIHVDFELTVMNVIRELFPDVTIKCCRFHLGQAWWRKIQNLGLSRDYKESSKLGNWFSGFFGLTFLPAGEIEDSFVGRLHVRHSKRQQNVRRLWTT